MKSSTDFVDLLPFSLFEQAIFDTRTATTSIINAENLILKECNSPVRYKYFKEEIQQCCLEHLSSIISVIDSSSFEQVDSQEKVSILKKNIKDIYDTLEQKLEDLTSQSDIKLRQASFREVIITFNSDIFNTFRNLNIDIRHFSGYKFLSPQSSSYSEDIVFITIIKKLSPDYLSAIFSCQSITIFNYYLQSVLKAEYLYDAELSERISNINTKIKDKIIGEVGRSTDTIIIVSSSINPDEYLKRLISLNSLYYCFNRKIERLIDDNDALIMQSFSEDDYLNDLNNYNTWFDNYEVHYFNPITLLGISKIFPVVFSNLLDMTYIDHNFVVSDVELNKLLILRNTLQQVVNVFNKLSDFVINDSFQSASANAFKEHYSFVIKEFIETLKLIELKNNILIWKIIDSDKTETLKNYSFICNGKFLTFNSNRKNYDNMGLIFLKKEDLFIEFSEDRNNELLKHREFFYSKNKVNNDTSAHFREYENVFVKLINYNKNIEGFKELVLRMEKILQNMEFESSVDINKYNRKRICLIEEQFLRFGSYIKRIGQYKSDEQEYTRHYIKEIISILEKEEVKPIYSCSFLIKHIEWCFVHLELLMNKEDPHTTQLINELLALSDYLLKNLYKLVNSIKRDCYCFNFGSLYQDSFYSYEVSSNSNIKDNKISRIKINVHNEIKTEIFSNIVNKHTFFIASSWQSPIGKTYLINTNNELYRKKNELHIKAQVLLRKLQLKDFEELIRPEIDKNNRNTMQILGVLAAFLAFSTMSVDAIAKFSTVNQFIQVISGITFCLTYFVILLHFIGNPKTKWNKNIILIIILATLLLM